LPKTVAGKRPHKACWNVRFRFCDGSANNAPMRFSSGTMPLFAVFPATRRAQCARSNLPSPPLMRRIRWTCPIVLACSAPTG